MPDPACETPVDSTVGDVDVNHVGARDGWRMRGASDLLDGTVESRADVFPEQTPSGKLGEGGCVPTDCLPAARCPLAAPLLPPVGLADMGLGVGWGRVRHSAGAREPGKEPQNQIPRFPFRSPIFPHFGNHLWNNRGAWVPSARVKIAGLSKFIAPPASPSPLRHLDVLVPTPALFCVEKQETSIHGQFVDSAQHPEHHGRVSSYHFEMGHAQPSLGVPSLCPPNLPACRIVCCTRRATVRAKNMGARRYRVRLVGSGQQQA